LATPTGDVRNYLVVGSDSREGITEDTPNVGAIGTDVTGRRSDTIIVLRTQGDSAVMMSIPRDLWVTNASTGKQGRVNAAYNDGPANLVRTITSSLGIPIHHYVEVDFVSFAGMVDAMGGITIDFPHPATDRNSGLDIPKAGPQKLDGTQALAYVRSRHYTEIIDGTPHQDPTADLGRQQRQQTFIRTVLREVGATRNPITAIRLVNAAADGVRVDDTLGVGDVWSLARKLAGTEPESVILPTEGTRKGSAAVLVLAQPQAGTVLARFADG
jgi:LCP family protein required for cell wall assembly